MSDVPALIPPFERYLIRLRLGKTSSFRFNHGAVISGLLRAALSDHDLPVGFIPFACESGQTRFEPRDPYHIGLTLVGEARALWDDVCAGLTRVGQQPADPDLPLPALGGNFTLEGAEPLPPADLEGQAACLANRESLTLQFVSPLRLERPASLRVKGGTYFDKSCFPGGQFLSRVFQRLFALAQGRAPSEDEQGHFMKGALPDIPADILGLAWLDIPTEGLPARRKAYTLGGVVGRVRLSKVPPQWIPLLVAGQYLHVGINTRFGLGRYRTLEAQTATPDPFGPARTVRDRAATPEGLHEALRETVAKSEAAGVDHVTPQGFAADQAEPLRRLASELRGGTYKPAPLLGFIAPKKDGRLRALAIPTVRDRIAQRAAAAVLGPAIDALLEDCSYAYRKGFSRQGAARAIQKAYADGYRYVLDADITSFFDAVDWGLLFGKLEALFPFESLVETICGWMSAPVVFDGRTIERSRGLPQGAPLSPLLANLFLDELDEDILGHDYRLVRFADDFVVLCKDLKAAEEAKREVCKVLASLDLALNEEKTPIRSVDVGFTYLGYLFCRSVALETDKHKSHGAPPLALSEDAVPATSWLSHVDFERVKALVLPGPYRYVPAGWRSSDGRPD